MADLAAISASGMDAVLIHHIGLAQPQRVLVLGTGLATMLGAAPAVLADQPLREINHVGGNTPVMVSETLDALMEMPRLKARFWKRWIEWSASL
jgi:DNA polymerase